jgi:D-beta-D-heptose 7-phosphate kinase/D-beta-D-heptose 1-phosphate adenosyltransferase
MFMDLAVLRQLLTEIGGTRVVVVGDVMVDRFVYGNVGRISPEAPIAVMARSNEIVMLGGAGNVARNAAALGASAVLVGVVGADTGGKQAIDLFQWLKLCSSTGW